MNALAVFLLAFLLDVLWAQYIQWTAERRRWMAGLASVGTALCGALGTVAIVGDTWLLLPYLAGIFLGTVVGVGRANEVR